MAEETTHTLLDHQAEQIADCFNELPWCEINSFLVVEEEEGGDPDPKFNHYLQAYEALVFDGYVTDFLRLVRRTQEQLQPRFDNKEVYTQVTVAHLTADDPNQVPLTLMVHYDGPDDRYLSTRMAVLDVMDRVVRETVEEWAQEEEEEPVEALV